MPYTNDKTALAADAFDRMGQKTIKRLTTKFAMRVSCERPTMRPGALT